jgi:hypothetical protein
VVDRMSARRQREGDSNCSDYYADFGHGSRIIPTNATGREAPAQQPPGLGWGLPRPPCRRDQGMRGIFGRSGTDGSSPTTPR